MKRIALSFIFVTFLLIIPFSFGSEIDSSGQTYSASTTFGANPPSNAFDGNVGTFWWSDNGALDEWLKIEFDNPTKVNRVRIYHSDVTTLVGNIEASNDDSTWTILDTFSHDTKNVWFHETFSNQDSYSYYRLNFTQDAVFWVQIMEWELHNETPPEIEIILPQAITYNNDDIYLNVSTTSSIVDTWWYSLNGADNITFTPNITLANLTDSSYVITVYANDTVGNEVSKTVSFTVTTVVPEFGEYAILFVLITIFGFYSKIHRKRF